MKKNMTFKAIKNTLFTVALLLPLQLGIEFIRNDATQNTNENLSESIQEDVYLNKTHVVLLDLDKKYCNTNCIIVQNMMTVEFLSNTFGVNSEDVKNDLIDRNAGEETIENNIGRLLDKNGNLNDYGSFEKGLIEYLYDFVKKNPKKVDNTHTPYEGDSEYIINLIRYFTSIYDTVDYLTAVSIGASESGHYKVKYMLSYNNVYGGMGSSGLIKYKNIEYGVLSFIRLLSYNYYGQGLNTVETIGRVYCPEYNEYGEKIASPHWVSLVNGNKKIYKDSYEEISVSYLLHD